MHPVQIILCGIGLLCVAMTVRRIAKRRPTTGSRHGHSMVDTERATRQLIDRFEVRLHEFEREVDGKLRTRLATLDHLIAEADHRIAELDRQLETLRTKPSAPTLLASTDPPEQQSRQTIDRLLTRLSSDRKAA